MFIKYLTAEQLVAVLGVPHTWADYGPLIEKHRLDVRYIVDGMWFAESHIRHGYGHGETPLLAIGRAVVAELNFGHDTITV